MDMIVAKVLLWLLIFGTYSVIVLIKKGAGLFQTADLTLIESSLVMIAAVAVFFLGSHFMEEMSEYERQRKG